MPIDSINFDRADYGISPALNHCAFCTRGIDLAWFEVESQRICEPCATQVRTIHPADTREKFLRSLAAGILSAALAGLLYYQLFRLTDGSWMVFAAIGLGFLIGKAMRLGSHDLGGRRYQVAAAILTYATIAIATSAAANPGTPFWAYPLLVFAPVIQLFTGLFSFAALQLFFAFLGIRWAWSILAGVPWKITGPHPASESNP